MSSLGQQLEDDLFTYLTSSFVPEILGLCAKRSVVYRRKKYFSVARGSTIEFDASIELALKGAESPFLIWLWECKDYNRQVGVEDLEEFDSKVRQIGEHNTKGTVVTRHGFQKSAISFAKSRGIGLARLFASEQLHIILHSVVDVHVPNPAAAAGETMTLPPTSASCHSVGGLTSTGDWFVRENLPDPNEHVPRVNRGLLEYIALELHQALPPKEPDRCVKCVTCPPSKCLRSEQEVQTREGKTCYLLKSYAVCAACLTKLRLAVYTTRGLGFAALVGLLFLPPLAAVYWLPGPGMPLLGCTSFALMSVLAFSVATLVLCRGSLTRSWYNQWALDALMSQGYDIDIATLHVLSWRTEPLSRHQAHTASNEPPQGGVSHFITRHNAEPRSFWLLSFVSGPAIGIILGEVVLSVGVYWFFNFDNSWVIRSIAAVLLLWGAGHLLHALANLRSTRVGHFNPRGFVLRDLLIRSRFGTLWSLAIPPPLLRSFKMVDANRRITHAGSNFVLKAQTTSDFQPSGSAHISYHSASTTSLSGTEETRLLATIREGGISVSMQTRAVDDARLTPVTIRSESDKIILVIEANFLKQEATAHLVRQFYCYFASLLKMTQDGLAPEIGHYALFFHVTSGGRSFDVGIDFNNAETLTINSFRLAEFFKNPKGKKTRLGIVELEYPKRPLKIPLLATVLTGIYLVAYPGIATWLQFVGGAIVALWWGAVVLTRYSTQLCAYRRKFTDKAMRWIDNYY